MRILPVMDLKGGVVVRAVAGRRNEYQPICSLLVSHPRPATVAAAFADQCGFSEVYVADLDAIAGAEPSWKIYEQIIRADLSLIIDAGIASAARASQLDEFAQRTGKLAGAVIGSESIPNAQSLRSSLEIHGPTRSIFSLDLKQGRPLVANPAWALATPQEIVAEVSAVGFRRFIVLDLSAVGAGGGPVTVELCRQLREEFATLELISGGGVRNAEDVRALCNAGCDQVLVASALHDGNIVNGMMNGKKMDGKKLGNQ